MFKINPPKEKTSVALNTAFIGLNLACTNWNSPASVGITLFVCALLGYFTYRAWVGYNNE